MRWALKIAFFLFCIVPLGASSQDWFAPLYDPGFEGNTEKEFIYPSLHPITLPDKDTTKSFLRRKLFKEHFIGIRQDGLLMAINPLVNVYGGQSSEKENLIYRNTRGVEVKGAIGQHVSFATSFYETQLNGPVWIDDYYSKYGVLPGETSAKGYGEDGYDIGSVYGVFAVQQRWRKWDFTFRAGYDNLYIGNGFRSLFLSDYSLPFLHGAVRASIKDIDYMHLTGSLQNPNHRNVMGLETAPRPSTAPYQKKTLAIHYLQWKITDKIKAGFFEGTVYQVADSAERRFSLQYVNPLPLSNLFAYGLDGKNNVMLGADVHISWSPEITSYFQWMQDTRAWEGTGFLVSLRYRTPSFRFLVEGTHIGDEAVAHHDPRQSFTHYNQPLTHPAGGGLDEVVAEAGYRFGRFEATGRIIVQEKQQGLDFRVLPESNAAVSSHTFYNGTLRYVMNPNTRLQVFANMLIYKNDDLQESFYRFGIKTQLRRQYDEVTP